MTADCLVTTLTSVYLVAENVTF